MLPPTVPPPADNMAVAKSPSSVALLDHLFEQMVDRALWCCEFDGERISAVEALRRLHAHQASFRRLCETSTAHAKRVSPLLKTTLWHTLLDAVKSWPEYAGPRPELEGHSLLAKCVTNAVDLCQFKHYDGPGVSAICRQLSSLQILADDSAKLLNRLWDERVIPMEGGDDGDGTQVDCILKRASDLEEALTSLVLPELERMDGYLRRREDDPPDFIKERRAIYNRFETRVSEESSPPKFHRGTVLLTDASQSRTLLEDLNLFPSLEQSSTAWLQVLAGLKTLLTSRVSRLGGRVSSRRDRHDSGDGSKTVAEHLEEVLTRPGGNVEYRRYRGKALALRFDLQRLGPQQQSSKKEANYVLVPPSLRDQVYTHGCAIRALPNGDGFVCLYESGVYLGYFEADEYMLKTMNVMLCKLLKDLQRDSHHDRLLLELRRDSEYDRPNRVEAKKDGMTMWSLRTLLERHHYVSL